MAQTSSGQAAFTASGPTALIGVAAVQVGGPAAAQTSVPGSYRVRCLVTAYLTMGPTNGVSAVGAPVAGAPSANTYGMTAGQVETYGNEFAGPGAAVPVSAWFISTVAASFEVTPGEGI